MIVLDTMVLIHLSKIGLLEAALELHGGGLIPVKVYDEAVVRGKKEGHADAPYIEELVRTHKIRVKKADAKTTEIVERIGMRGGEGECVALAKQTGFALATDDDAVRAKKERLQVKLRGTLSLVVELAEAGKIPKAKALEALSALRRIGWFSSAVIDKARLVVEHV